MIRIHIVLQKQRYFINYNPKIWNEAEISDSTNTDEDNSLFVAKQGLVFSTVYLNTEELPSSVQSDLENEVSNEQLEKFADTLEKDFELTSPIPGAKITYKGREIVVFNDRLAIRFEFGETVLSSESTYYEYVIPYQDFYLEVEVKSANNLADEVILPEFIAGIQFSPNSLMVKGATTGDGLNEVETTALLKPSVVSILHTYCNEIKGGDQAIYLKSYKVCKRRNGFRLFCRRVCCN